MIQEYGGFQAPNRVAMQTFGCGALGALTREYLCRTVDRQALNCKIFSKVDASGYCQCR